MRKRSLFILTAFMMIIFLGIGCGTKEKDQPKNLVIILIDALRLDHLGVYGYERDTSPHMDEFASHSLVFNQAISQSGWTAPAVMALFSSHYPKNNLNNSQTFAQWLSEHNFQTAAFTTNPIMIKKMGYHRGFQTYELHDWKKGAALVDLSLDWVHSRDPDKPFCLYLHFMDVHSPYQPPEPYNSQFGAEYKGPVDGNIKHFKEKLAEDQRLNLSEQDIQKLRDLYDGEIRYTDTQFKRLMEGLRQAGVYDDSIIVLVSDHGEEFMEHEGLGHGHSVFEELIHIPLIIKGLDEKSREYDGLFELIDLAPTLMDKLNIPFDYDVAGQSGLKNIPKNKPLKEVAYSEVHRTMGFNAGKWAVSARTDTKKVIYYPHEKKFSFYDLSADRNETMPLENEVSDTMRKLAESLVKWREVFGSTSKHKVYDKEYLDALRSLGYIK